MEEEKRNHEQASDRAQVSGDHENPVVRAEAEGSKEVPQSQTSENPDQNPATAQTNVGEEEWVTGIKSAVILITLTVAAFLMLLDTSIVATVSLYSCVRGFYGY